jgi:DNA-binding helix-hairpin-helix protein with protein kinase domain
MLADIARMADPPPTSISPAEPEVAAHERDLPTRPGEPPPAEVRNAGNAHFPAATLVTASLSGAIAFGLVALNGPRGWLMILGMLTALLGLAMVTQASRWHASTNARKYVKAYEARSAAITNELAALGAAERAGAEFSARCQSLTPRTRRLRAAAAQIADHDRRASAEIQSVALGKFKERWLDEQMSAFLIGPAVIPGIGQERKRVLASHGIETAADVNARDVRQVPGFGPKLTEALTDWRTDCARLVAKRPLPQMPQGFVESLRREHSLALAKSVEGIRVDFVALRQELASNEAAARSHSIAISAARAAFRQARMRASMITAPN